MANDTRRSSQPSWWWALAALSAVIAVAWIAGSSGGGITDAAPPTLDFPSEPTDSTTDRAGLDRIDEAEAFWGAIGAGDADAARAMLHPEAPLPLVHYAEFAAAFEAGLRAEGCRAVADDVVRCLLGASNTDLVDLYWAGSDTTAYLASASITFTERGIESFQLPGVINRASNRMLAHAIEISGIPTACNRINYDAIDLPPFNTSMAQTADCARALLPYLPGAIASEVP